MAPPDEPEPDLPNGLMEGWDDDAFLLDGLPEPDANAPDLDEQFNTFPGDPCGPPSSAMADGRNPHEPSSRYWRVFELLAHAPVATDGMTKAEDIPSPPPVAPAKRGPGRPRKAPPPAAEPAPAPSVADQDAEADAAGPPGQDAADIDLAIVERCAGLDNSDAGNGERVVAHFGKDMLVQRTNDSLSSAWVVWTEKGTHWDRDGGEDAALRRLQKLGPRIALEAEYLKHTPAEAEAIAKARRITARPQDTWSDEDRATVTTANKAGVTLESRRAAKRRFAVQSRNVGRLNGMKVCAAPYLTRDPNDFNADRSQLATLRHTLRFTKRIEVRRELDLDCPDPDVERWVETKQVLASVDVTPGHRREDLITKLLPVAYDPDATCPKWVAFLDEFLPSEAVRRCVQVFSGLGLTGIPLQRVMFHFGSGANGKSVFLETLMKLVGPLGVGLPAASLVGESRASGQQASPDIARLYGARSVRVAELPQGQPLKEELVKVLTGGEAMPVRNLFKGFFDFEPQFKAHMSGNGYPRIEGTDEGIWRRMTVVHWPVTVPPERRRELNEIVDEFVQDEGPGILNWLIEGVLTYLREGFTVPDEVKASTQEYRDEMDPIGQFATECISVVGGQNVQARVMFRAYVAWSAANGKRHLNETKFGRTMKARYTTTKISVQVYTNVQLHDVPPMPDDMGLPEER